MKPPQCTSYSARAFQQYQDLQQALWFGGPQHNKTRGVSHCGLAICIKKYLEAKEELWKLKYFTIQRYNLQNILLKKSKILQDIVTLTTLKFQHKPKYHLAKILI
jgi:hypothetical protein